MGGPKAWLPVGAETFLQRVVAVLRTVVSPVVVVSAPDQVLPALPADVLVTVDELPGRGPLQGLLAGLERIRELADAAYVSSCDVPLLRPAFVRRLVSLGEGYEITVAETAGMPHPLAGVYSVAVRDSARALLAADQRSVRLLLERHRVRLVGPDALRDVDPELASLRNVNTPQEYALLRCDLSDEDCREQGGR